MNFKLNKGIDSGVVSPLEIQWFLVEAWNNGVYFYRLGQFEHSEKWMSIALTLSKKFLHKDMYEVEMMTGYSEVLKLLEEQRRKSVILMQI